MAQEDRIGGGTYRRFDDDEPKENNWGGKVALFALMLCACYFIYKYHDARTPVEKLTEVEKDKSGPGFLGKVETVPTLEDYEFSVRFNDAASAKYGVVYKLRPDITQEQINQYDPNVTKAQIRDIVQKTAINMSSIESYANKGEMVEQLKRQIAEQLNSQQIDLFQIQIEYDQNVMKYIQKKKEEQMRLEFANAEAVKMEAIADAEVRINKAKEKIREAEIARQKREQFIIDSMKFVYEKKLKELQK